MGPLRGILLVVTALLLSCRDPHSFALESDGPIYVLTTLTNVTRVNKRLAYFSRMFDSVLFGAQRQPLHWIILSNADDVATIHRLVQRIIGSKSRVPVKVEFIDIKALAAYFAPKIHLIREYFTCREPLTLSDYFNEVFHMGAIYHLIFPFARLIALDVDLHFQNVDIAYLQLQFDRMGPSSLISMAYDQSPHYWYFFREYRHAKYGKSAVGYQRESRGFNAGVILMNLERMRQNRIYNSYLKAAKLDQLVDKYGVYGCLAYQDFFTFLSLEEPQLFTQLDCTWNRQLDEVYRQVVVSEQVFEAFHRCDGQVQIYHANGGSFFPEDKFE